MAGEMAQHLDGSFTVELLCRFELLVWTSLSLLV